MKKLFLSMLMISLLLVGCGSNSHLKSKSEMTIDGITFKIKSAQLNEKIDNFEDFCKGNSVEKCEKDKYDFLLLNVEVANNSVEDILMYEHKFLFVGDDNKFYGNDFLNFYFKKNFEETGKTLKKLLTGNRLKNGESVETFLLFKYPKQENKNLRMMYPLESKKNDNRLLFELNIDLKK